jgi:hypothetical protein
VLAISTPVFLLHADLKGLVGVERDAREEIAERVLKREAEYDAEQRRAREQRAERQGLEVIFEYDGEGSYVEDEREDVAHQARRFVALTLAEEEEDERV